MCEPEGKGGGTQIEPEKNLYWKIQSHHLPWDLGHWMVDLSSALRTCWEDPTLNWKQEGQKKPVHAMVLTYTFSWECTPFVAGRWVGADTWQTFWGGSQEELGHCHTGEKCSAFANKDSLLSMRSSSDRLLSCGSHFCQAFAISCWA